MTSLRLRAIAGTCLIALITVATAGLTVPQPVRVVLGVPLVFLLSGFAILCTVLPDQQLSWGERLLASLGLSLAMTTCVAVILAATPIGLSKTSFAVALGGITLAMSVSAWFRTGAQLATRQVLPGSCSSSETTPYGDQELAARSCSRTPVMARGSSARSPTVSTTGRPSWPRRWRSDDETAGLSRLGSSSWPPPTGKP